MSYTQTPAANSSNPPAYRQSSSGPGPSTATRQARVRSHNARQTEPLERFFVTGQPTGRSPAATARQLDAWDARWADASSRR